MRKTIQGAFEGKDKVLTPDFPMHPKEAIGYIHKRIRWHTLNLYSLIIIVTRIISQVVRRRGAQILCSVN